MPFSNNLVIKFYADKVIVRGPKIDGGYSVTLEVGEYEQKNISQLFLIPQQTTVKVTVEEQENAKDH